MLKYQGVFLVNTSNRSSPHPILSLSPGIQSTILDFLDLSKITSGTCIQLSIVGPRLEQHIVTMV